MGTLESGVKWSTGVGTALYTGVFVDYGFNNALKNAYSEKRFVEYNRANPSQPVMNTACVVADRFSPLAFGVKVKFAFSAGCRDLLNDRKAYKKLQSQGNFNDGFFDFDNTCDLGTDGLNLRIGQERADLAKDYLVEKGVAPPRIATFSKGKSEPLFPNSDELSRRKNRRLELKIRE
jgi:hypothetical protein